MKVTVVALVLVSTVLAQPIRVGRAGTILSVLPCGGDLIASTQYER